ncbi:peptidoglycan-binding protein [Phormidium tenue FACHB-886]|nr:peptidoglycan-binding protein [Phormidium tenue FACHB-886]
MKLKQFKLQTPKLSSLTSGFIWKGLLSVMAIASVLSIAPKASADLFFGNTGSDVRNLQTALGISADGVYGRETELAVIRYQRSCGLQVDGIAGDDTLSSIASGTCIADGDFRPIFPGDDEGFRPILPGGEVGGPYVVVVPDTSRLDDVQQFVPNAFLADASGERGEYINAGGYRSREDAGEASNRLRNNGLPARVVFRP